MDITTRFLHLTFPGPVILASGIMDVTASAMLFVVENGAGGVVTKSIGEKPRYGHKSPILLSEPAYTMNAVGLSNPGVEDILDEIRSFKKRSDVPIIASIFGHTADEFGRVAKKISEAEPDLIEVNISCPNVEDDIGKPFALTCPSAAKVTRIVKKNTDIPISVKLSPNVPDIGEIAAAVEEAGADAISAVNTYGPGMVIDTDTAKPVLANKVGGVSGPAIRPLAVKAVWDIYKAVSIPIMGIGGITTGDDAIQMFMAGASAVQIGSAVYYRGIDVFSKVNEEIEEFMESHGYQSIEEMVGVAHG